MDPLIRTIIKWALIALAIGLCVNVYQFSADPTLLAALGMGGVFVAGAFI